MMLAYNLYQEDPESILPQACGLETYHNFTLLHDDLMDHADMRRGHPTVHVKWDANTAILSGDTMLLMAFKLMMQCPQEHMDAVLDVFTETTLEIGEGQQYDMTFETRDDVREEEYIEMIRLKTSVLLACALLLFVCGRKSINGRVLFNECQRVNANSHLIEGPNEIDPSWFNDELKTIGICGATSTPKWLMEECRDAILK